MLKNDKQSDIIEKNHPFIEEDLNSEDAVFLFYTKHKVELDSIWKTSDICDIITLASILIFFICLIIKIALILSFSWFYLLLPASFAIISYTITLCLFIKSLDIGSESVSYNKYIIVNLTSVSTITYLIIFCLKMELMIISPWLLVSIPAFVAIFFVILYQIFIIPTYIHKKAYFEISVVAMYLIIIPVFTYMLHQKLDNLNSGFTFSQTFIPLLLAASWHLVYAMYYIFWYNHESLIKKIFQLSGILLLICSLVLLMLIADKKVKMDFYFPILIMMFSIIFLLFFYTYKFMNLGESWEHAHMEKENYDKIEC